MNSVYEKALMQAKHLVYDQGKSIGETLEKLAKISPVLFDRELTLEELEGIKKELDKNQDHAFIIASREEFKPWIHTIDTDGYYSKLYENFLLHQQKFPPNVVKTIGVDTRLLTRM